ncbi:MPN527 family putative ECF transporter permease subunit [Mycoplasma sp. 'Moose RK']|uniref:MPN527 family putative ECF transporter permease subunit n=1 Tax=Mycoplasma sp. 'Moose RK' TaxID=2780095 RepID=UPI0018C2F451|nr:hypothetical protein [Mycoplasma sp. 'Moose RK']MBG0730869.1 hypothetical protein [Mycoplasma sp. 'Moose RK']
MKKSLYWKNNYTFKIAIGGILLSLSLIFFIFSHNYFSWPFFQLLGLKFDLSTLFLVPIFLIADIRIGIYCLIIRFGIGPWLIFNHSGGIGIIYFGHFVLLLASTIYIFSFLFFYWVSLKLKLKVKFAIAIALLDAILITSFIMTLLNGVLITPVYLKLYKITDSISLNNILVKWSEISKKFGGIKLSYWSFIFAAFFPFNLANFVVESALAFPLYIVITAFIKKRVRN